jgi:acyl-CoA thioester hydrolase
MDQTDKTLEAINNSLPLFKFSITGRVKFHEVDSYGIVHNIQYLYWLEWARAEYLRKISQNNEGKLSLYSFPVMVVHSEIDFFSTAGFDDEYEILTRAAFVKNSSVGFENIIRLTDGSILVKASAVLVGINVKTRQPDRINDTFREWLKNYEVENIKFID